MPIILPPTKYKTSTKGILPALDNPKLAYKVVCNVCGCSLTIHYWEDGDVMIDPCAKKCEG